jgi:hypothetical protein
MNITEMDIVSFISKAQDIINKAMKYDLLQVTEEDIEIMQEKARKYDKIVSISLHNPKSGCKGCILEHSLYCNSMCDIIIEILDTL